MMPVEVDWDVVEEITDLDKPFKKALSKAEDEEEPGLRLEWAEAKAEFYARQAQKASLAVARREALDKYPLAKDWSDEIRGTTPAEIEAAAKRIHERLEKATKDTETAKQATADAERTARQAAQQSYGAPASTGGGTPARPAVASYEADDEYIRNRLRDGDGLNNSKDRLVQQRWQATRVAQAVNAAIHDPSYRSFSRPNTAEDKRIADERAERRKASGR